MPAGRPPAAKSLKEYFGTALGKKKWNDALEKSKATSFGEYNDGTYKVQLIKAEVNTSKASGRLQHVFGFKFIDGEYKGSTVYQYQGVENETGISILIQNLRKLGYDVTDAEEIEEADPKLAKSKPVVTVKLKTNGEYQNLAIIGVEGKKKDEEEEDVDDEETDTESKSNDNPYNSDDDDDDKDDSKSDKDADEDDDEETEDEDEEDDDEDSEEEDEEKPKKKSKDEDEDEEDEDEKPKKKETKEVEADEVNLEVGTKVKVKYDGDEVKATIVKIIEENEDGTGLIKVKLANGDKVKIEVPDGIVDIL